MGARPAHSELDNTAMERRGARRGVLIDSGAEGGFPKKGAVGAIRAETPGRAWNEAEKVGREQLMKGFMGPAEEFEPYSEDRSRIPAKDGEVASRHELSVTV